MRTQLLGGNFQNFDFYSCWQSILGKSFSSSLAQSKHTTHAYELQDSVLVGQDLCYRFAYPPRRAHDLAFNGTPWIMKERYALWRIEEVTNAEATINFATDLRIISGFDTSQPGP